MSDWLEGSTRDPGTANLQCGTCDHQIRHLLGSEPEQESGPVGWTNLPFPADEKGQLPQCPADGLGD